MILGGLRDKKNYKFRCIYVPTRLDILPVTQQHYVTVVRLIDMWPSVLEVLQIVFDDSTQLESVAQVRGLYQRMQTFEFVFSMILMKRLLGMTNRLSMVFQEKDANILNAIIQIKAMKIELQSLRESGWDGLLNEVETFC